MEFFEKMFEAPKAPKDDEYEKGVNNLKKIRSIKKEDGYSHTAKILNEKIKSEETIGEYELDDTAKELSILENLYEEMRQNPKIKEYLENLNVSISIQYEIKALEDYLQRVLSDSDSEEIDYNQKILELNSYKKDKEIIDIKINQADKETVELVDKYIEIEDKIELLKIKLKEKYGNKDIQTEQGQYLN